ncbi:hypothetical protein ACFGVR_13760 [Mucilaginibacter sp. AW1-3]
MKLLSLTLTKCLLCCAFTLAGTMAYAQKSEWVYAGADGKLVYKALPAGDKIMDFSSAGYMGGGVSIPDVAVKVTLNPVDGDNAEAIQSAIDQAGKMPLVNGFRGAVLLSAGKFDCSKTININVSGVVLRGSGSGEKGTVINMTGDPHVCVAVRVRPVVNPAGPKTTLADAYVPSAAKTFNVAGADGFAAGDVIQIIRKVTPQWLAFMGMDNLVRDGKKETWVNGDIITDRVIEKVSGNSITVTVPLSDSYDAKYTGSVAVQKVNIVDEQSKIGIENFRIVSVPQSVTITQGHNSGINMGGIVDGWIRNMELFNTVNSVSITGKRITVDNLSIIHDVATLGSAKPADLNGSGSQVLFNKCTIAGDNVFYLATGPKVSGPVVLLNCVFKGGGWIQPHQRWATGLLVDNCQVPGGGIEFMNRGEMGSGHGWAIGWAVAWNCTAKNFLNQMPPGSQNWLIGCKGDVEHKAMPFEKTNPILPDGIIDSQNKPVAPQSLYLTQLKERLGAQALKNIGY